MKALGQACIGLAVLILVLWAIVPAGAQGTAITNIRMWLGNAVVSTSNPVPVSDAGGSFTVDGTVTTTSDDQQADDDNIAFGLTGPDVNAKLYVSNGTNWVRAEANLDPCAGSAKTPIPINISTATTTELTASLAGASTHYYVCSINLGPTAGAQNLALVDDDSDGCGSVTSGLAGGTTAGSGWNFPSGGGLALGDGTGTVARTNGTNRVLCAVTSAAVQISGVMTVVAAP